MFSSFVTPTGSNISEWKSSGLCDKDDVSLKARQNGKLNVRFSKNMLKQTKIAYSHGSVINVYITYRLRKRTINNRDFTLGNCLFGAVKITKDVNTSHYKYSSYGIAYDHNGSYSFGNNNNSRNLIIFGCDISFSTHANNRANNIYKLGKYFIQGVNGTAIYAEKMYKTDPSIQEKMYVLSLHYNGDNSYLFINGTQELKFKAKNSELNKNTFCVGNISEDFSNINMDKTSLFGNVYDLSIDY